MRAVTPDRFRRAWSNFATGVTVITTLEADGVSVHGMTANGVASVSLEPPLAMVIVAHERNTYPLIVANQRFGISVLSLEQQSIARYFTVPNEVRRQLSPPETEPLGASKVIRDSLSAMDCRVVESFVSGDHTVFIAEVERLKIAEGEPLLYFRSNFASLAST